MCFPDIIFFEYDYISSFPAWYVVPWPQLSVFRAHHIIFVVFGKVLIENIVIVQKVWDNGLNIHTMYKAPTLKRKKVSYSETVSTC